MELELSLGERASKASFGFIEEARAIQGIASLGFSMGLSVNNNPNSRDYKRKQEQDELEQDENEEDDEDTEEEDQENRIEEKTINKPFLHYQQQTIICSEESPLIQLDLLPNTPVPRHNHHEDRAAVSCSPPNSGASSFQMDFGTYNKNGNIEGERGSDEDENGCSRKKLRLSKQQSAFLEESFKEHHTLNPKQKLALAKQLNLRPRQVEVWFQNRRARTKLKQTEVDCEFLKRCCERLTQENSKLRKELQELRALKSSNPFNMHLPATTLTMCPSCERVATTTATAAAPANPTTTNSSPEPAATSNKATDFDLSLSTRTRFLPFNHPRIS